MNPQVTVARRMTPAPVTVASDCPVPQLEKLFVEHSIGALPIVDNGSLKGIVSRSDVMRRICVERSVAEVVSVANWDLSGFDENPSESAKFSEIAERLGCRIDHLIAADVIGETPREIASDEPLTAAARMMSDHRIHHLLVVDRGALVGVISSFDIVRHVAEMDDRPHT